MSVEEIWVEYRAALKLFLHAKVSNEADVEDLLQDILIKTYNNLEAVKKQKSIKSWLFQIANHTIIDYYRKKGRVQSATMEELFPQNDDLASSVELSHCLSPFINSLPEQYASLLTEIDLNNKSQKLYAEELGISYSTLKSRVQKSRNLLKQVFDNCCHFKIDNIGNVYDYYVKTKNDTCE